MSNVFEDSPWHREATVAVHTNMVVSEYLATLTKKSWSEGDLLGAFVCAFHDVGKPAARTEAYKPERGTYYRYVGHELISARIWEDWAVNNWKFLESEFGMVASSIYRVSWMIENHLPWSVKKEAKRRALAVTAMYCGSGNIQPFINVLKADTWGRISDDATEKRAKVNAWCDEFIDYAESVHEEVKAERSVLSDDDSPIIYIPIGVSGSGKSTLFDSESMDCILKKDGIDVDRIVNYSLDALRMAWYDHGGDYQKAWTLACDDKTFNSKARTAFNVAVQEGCDIYLDNMNLSRKSRAGYIQTARQHGYRIHAILLPVALQTVLDRQSTRTDKTLPKDAVRDMYMRLSIPSKTEVDRIITYSGNLPKT